MIAYCSKVLRIFAKQGFTRFFRYKINWNESFDQKIACTWIPGSPERSQFSRFVLKENGFKK